MRAEGTSTAGERDTTPPAAGMSATRWTPDWFARFYAEVAQLPTRPVDEQRAIRRALAADPIAFAVLYLSHHLRDSDGHVTFSEVHFDWASIAAGWRARPVEPAQDRHAFVAPRETGKTTWWYLVIPLWAAANGYVRFIAAFANEDGLAQGHLHTFKHELDTNPLLRVDYPELCTPARKQSGGTVADRQGMLHSQSGFVFAARGIDASNLGMKVGHQRPDLIILDDVEKDEARYSAGQAEKRLGTITDAIMPLNIYARLVLVGTVTMPGSVVHQVVKAAQGVEVADWITDERVQCHWYNAIQTNDDGTERSIWPAKWSLDYLVSIRHTRSYAKNYLNDPMGHPGSYWSSDDFRYGTLGPRATRWILQVDPAVTTKGTSDWTGLAVVGHMPPSRDASLLPPAVANRAAAGLVEVAHAEQVKLAGETLRQHILRILARFPRIKAVRVEVNQGGDLWYTVLHDLPVQLLVHTATVSKEVRFSEALDYYQRFQVLHTAALRVAEEQMVGFPRMSHDDVADAVSAGVLYFLSPPKVKKVVIRTQSYA